MGRIGRLLQFARRVATLDLGGGDVVTSTAYSTPGNDAHPLPGDYPLAHRVDQAGRYAVSGWYDAGNDAKADPGEVRSYARDSNGAVVSEVWQKNDGSVLLSNDAGSIELEAGGAVVINGVKIDAGTVTADNVDATVSSKAAGEELALHTHLAGVPPGDTGPNK